MQEPERRLIASFIDPHGRRQGQWEMWRDDRFGWPNYTLNYPYKPGSTVDFSIQVGVDDPSEMIEQMLWWADAEDLVAMRSLLEQMGTEHPRFADAFAEWPKKRFEELGTEGPPQLQAVIALGRVGEEEAAYALERLLAGSPSEEVRAAAAEARSAIRRRLESHGSESR